MNTGIQLTKEIFEELSWQEVIVGCKRSECFDYCSAFASRAVRAAESNDTTAHAVFDLLRCATFASLKTGSKNEPFLEEWLLSFSEDEVALFRELALGVSNAEMRARLADIVWERFHDPNMARLAIESYLKSAGALEQDHWVHSFDRLERATNIAHLLGPNSEQFVQTVKQIEDILTRYDGHDSSFFSARLMEILQEHRQGDSLKYAALAETAVQQAIAERECERARRYLFIEAEWYFRSDQSEMRTETRFRMLETHVEEGTEFVSSSNSSFRYSQACHKIERAIKGYQDFSGPGSKKRRDELYCLLRDYQKNAQEELSSFPVQAADDELEACGRVLGQQIVETIKGKSLEEALRTLASLPLLQDVAQIREPVERFVKTSPVALLFPLMMHNTDGRVAGRPPLKPSSEDEQIEAEIRAHMFKNSNDGRIWKVRTILMPAVEEIKREHHIRIADLIQIVVDNPFVPKGRGYLFARGLHAGLTGEYLNAAHWLIPEIENSLRHVLSLHGSITSGFNRQDVQNHYDLNRILNDHELEKSLAEVLGADLVFELKGLLVQHFGANLRNEIAHGTLGAIEFSCDFYGLQLVYLWWLVLRLCFTSVLPAKERSRAAAV